MTSTPKSSQPAAVATPPNPYLADPDTGLSTVDMLIRHAWKTGVLDGDEYQQVTAFTERLVLRPAPIERPFTPQEARAAAEKSEYAGRVDYYLTAVVAVALGDLIRGDVDSFNDEVSAQVTGSDIGVSGIAYTVVGGSPDGDRVLIEVTGDITDWLDENSCLTPGCNGDPSTSPNDDGYCATCTAELEARMEHRYQPGPRCGKCGGPCEMPRD